MITASSKRETLSDPLPLVPAELKSNKEAWKKSIHSLMKKQVVNVINGKPSDFESDLLVIVESIWQDGYSHGISHMDQMHKEVDNGR